ncbi:MAG: copper-binding protein [Burkholderiales bacterium]
MKTLVIAAALALSAATAAHSTTHNISPKSDAQQATHKAVGVVKKVDSKEGKVTLAHEAVKSLNWPAMTVTFKVEDKAVPDKLAENRKVEFDFEATRPGIRDHEREAMS